MAKSIRQKTIVEQLVDEIRNMIAGGSYKENDKLPTEAELAERFNVSRSSVREAIKTLSHLGILETRTSQGTRIAAKNRIAEEAALWSFLLGYEDMYEVFVLGTAIDTQVAVILIKKFQTNSAVNDTMIRSMNTLIDHMRAAAEENDLKKYSRAFSRYFRAMYKEADNTVFNALNKCIEGLINYRVCSAYHKTNNLKAATDLLASIWSNICRCDIVGTLQAVQDYGVFAYDVFAQCYEI